MPPIKAGLGVDIIRLQCGLTLPSITAFTVGPQSGPSLPVAITLIEGLTPPTAIYLVGVTGGSAAPSAAQIIAGQNGAGGAAAVVASIPIAVSGLSSISVTPPSTGTYDFYAVATDAGAAQSNRASVTGVAFVFYNPSTALAGYQFSILPETIGSLFTDTAGTVVVTTPGDLVACVRDPFTNAIVATQATSGNRPVYQVDGSGFEYLQMGDGVTARWLVTGTLPFNTNSINRAICSAAVQQDARPAGNAILFAHNNTGVGFRILAPEFTNTHSAGSRGTVNAATSVILSGTPPLKDVFSMYASIPNDNVVLRRNGTQVGQAVTDQGTGFYQNAVFSIGASSTGTTPFNGRLYGLVLAVSGSTDYTDTDAAPLDSYLDGKLR